jgi:hypothetical protein
MWSHNILDRGTSFESGSPCAESLQPIPPTTGQMQPAQDALLRARTSSTMRAVIISTVSAFQAYSRASDRDGSDAGRMYCTGQGQSLRNVADALEVEGGQL